MKTLITLMLLAISAGALGIDRKPITEVDLGTLTTETQAMRSNNNQLDLIWWIPREFWEATLYQDPSITQAQADEVLGVLGDYSVIGVIQADVSRFGSFKFFDRETVWTGLLVEHVAEDGKVSDIADGPVQDQDVNLILDQMRPILSAAMGNMGQNFYFFAMRDVDGNGERIVSPYDKGMVRAKLSPRQGLPPTVLEIELPLDSLMVPRICPNGKPAHVSWSYCPWSGERL